MIRNSKNLAVLCAITLLLALSACSNQSSDADNSQANKEQVHVIEMTSDGYSPSSLTIKKGYAVTFLNKGSEPAWPASSMHPTHLGYPGSGIHKCGTDEEKNIFDACKGINSGGSWSFVFNEAGNWKYHDHLSPKHLGSITVE